MGSHEEHTAQDIANEEENSENKGDYGEEKESKTEDRIGEQVNDSAKEEKDSEEEGNSDSEGEDQEKASESEGMDEKSEEENENMSEENEVSMAIGNIVITSSEEASEEKRTEELGLLLTHFTGDEKISSDEDDLPLSEVGKKPRKTPVKATRYAVLIRKEVAPPARTPLTRSKRKRKVAKATKTATPSARASRVKKRKNIPAMVDRLTELRNRNVLNRKILTNTDEKGMAQLVEKLKLQG
ncbi:uncharacterized protein [Nicotiana tomentosiformis]|uniref:uncharacterized protein n=1 Tax=Nicotiana tomentosiformis TaxID=4098 RepID=UPI00051BA5A2|nr:neurofilament medium polypeptide-like [Nicotiana tomentosiformis]